MNCTPAVYSPVTFDATHLTVAEFAEPITSFSQLMISLPLDDLEDDAPVEVKPLRHQPYPSPKSQQQPRRRRKREAIDIPQEIVGQCDANEVKKIKNRIAAARLRERSQQKIRDLEAEVIALRQRNAFLESQAAANGNHGCTEAASPIAIKSAPSSPVPCSPVTPVQCHSPSSLSEGASLSQHDVMQEFEHDLLHQLLWQSEELTMMQM